MGGYVNLRRFGTNLLLPSLGRQQKPGWGEGGRTGWLVDINPPNLSPSLQPGVGTKFFQNLHILPPQPICVDESPYGRSRFSLEILQASYRQVCLHHVGLGGGSLSPHHRKSEVFPKLHLHLLLSLFPCACRHDRFCAKFYWSNGHGRASSHKAGPVILLDYGRMPVYAISGKPCLTSTMKNSVDGHLCNIPLAH